jgi:biopolymer transport protein TolQ
MLTFDPWILGSGLSFGLENSALSGLVICGVLVVLSIVSWTVMLSKLWMISLAKKANSFFLTEFRNSDHPLALYQLQRHFEKAPLYHMYHAASRELAFQILGKEPPDDSFLSRLEEAVRITPSQMATVESAMERAAGEAAIRLESRLSAVAMALSGAPFLGLLGTVWGVMDSFAGLAGKTGMSLQAMAPGICAALLTTVVGLLVAIPSMFGYNYLVGRIRALIVRMDHFGGEFCSIIDRHFVNHGGTQEKLSSIATGSAPTMPEFIGDGSVAMPTIGPIDD